MTEALYPFAAIELGMIELLAAASKENVSGQPLLGYRLRQVESYKGQLNGGPKRVAELIRETPAVWICFENAKPQPASGLWEGTFVAVCVTKNARNEKAARHGAGDGEVGVYQVSKDVAALLDGQTFGVPHLEAMRCANIDAPFNAEFENTRAAIMVLTFQASWDPDGFTGVAGDAPSYPPGREAGRFAHFNADWDVPPFTAPKPAIPVDDATKRDARDTIHPPQE